jgi:molybdopterin/thiamine biosynthesis adenylyltransferase
MNELPPLTDEERATYEWQMWVPGFGEEGQRKLKAATVLVSRVGGLGGLVAHELAAAGVGRLILAHAGNLKRSDLNRQLLMRHDALGTSRIACAAATLKALNPKLDVVAISENITPQNAANLVQSADLVVSCAPRFEERYLMNEQAVRQGKPFIDCAMYELTGQVATTIPGTSACLRCRVPSPPEDWTRQFPVFGAVSGAVGCIGAMEAIKLICGIGEPLVNRLLAFDLREMRFRVFRTKQRPDCPVCKKLLAG